MNFIDGALAQLFVPCAIGGGMYAELLLVDLDLGAPGQVLFTRSVTHGAVQTNRLQAGNDRRHAARGARREGVMPIVSRIQRDVDLRSKLTRSVASSR